jgi:hypothetical protein
MCISAKDSLLNLALMSGLALALFIRNKGYDIIFASLLIIVSLIQLIEYLYHSEMLSSDTSGRSIYIILWLQLFVLGIAMYSYFKTRLTFLWAILFTLILIIAIYYSRMMPFSASKEGGHLVWGKNNGSIMGNSRWIYLTGLLVPLLIIQYYNNWSNKSIWILVVTFILTIAFVKYFFTSDIFPSLWCYSALAFFFVVWLCEAFSSKPH